MIIVHIDHAGARGDLPGDLMNVARRGDTSTDIDELPDPRLAGQEPHGPLHERPVRPRHRAHLGKGTQNLPDGLPVSDIVILARREVGSGRGTGLSTGPSPRTASRTRRAHY